MNLRFVRDKAIAIAAVVLLAGGGQAFATAISGNYCSVAPITLFPAGVFPVGNWNDFTSPAGYTPNDSATNPFYDDGTTATGVTFTWSVSDGGSQNSNDFVNRMTDVQDGHDQMMTGYLQASKYTSQVPTITLQATGLDPAAFGGSFSVVLYADGDQDVDSFTSRAGYEIWASEASFTNGDPPLAAYYGRDRGEPDQLNPQFQYAIQNDGTAPLSWYQRIVSTTEAAPTEGNYVQFDALTGTSFYARITGVANEHGGALNGFQIIPEAASLALMAIGLLLHRRTR